MKLSVVVPVYNGKKYIEECLRSIANQSLEDWELIVVDDCSADNTVDIVQRFFDEQIQAADKATKDEAKAPDKYHLLVMEENRGPAYCRSKGVEIAHGEYIGFVDADDWIDPEHYRSLIDCVEKTDADIACCNIIKDGSGLSPTKKNTTLLNADQALLEIFNRHSAYQYAVNKVYRASILKDMVESQTFPLGKFIGEDFMMVCQAVTNASPIAVIPTATYHYRIHGGSTTQQGFTHERKLAFKKYQEYISNFSGTPELKQALNRYMVLEYMSFLLAMYRSKDLDPAIESEILEFIKINRRDYKKNTGDGFAAKAFATIINPTLSKFFFRIWKRR